MLTGKLACQQRHAKKKQVLRHDGGYSSFGGFAALVAGSARVIFETNLPGIIANTTNIGLRKQTYLLCCPSGRW